MSKRKIKVPKVEKGISQQKPRHWGALAFYPYFKMNIGESFLVPDDLTFPYNVGREGSRSAALKGLPHRFKVGKTDKGYRCWRVS